MIIFRPSSSDVPAASSHMTAVGTGTPARRSSPVPALLCPPAPSEVWCPAQRLTGLHKTLSAQRTSQTSSHGTARHTQHQLSSMGTAHPGTGSSSPLSAGSNSKSLPGSSRCPSNCPHHQARPVVALRGRQSPCPWGHHHLVPRWPRATKPSHSRAPYLQPQPWDLPSSQKLPLAFQEPQPQPAVLGIPELLQPSSAQLGEGWNSQHTLPLGAIHGREMELRSHPAQVLPESCPFTPDKQLETACHLPATPAQCHPPASSVTTTCRMPFTSPSHRRLFTPR